LNAKTLKTEEFWREQTPPYAALSHRWENEEVGFEEIGTPAAEKKRGCEKIKKNMRPGSE